MRGWGQNDTETKEDEDIVGKSAKIAQTESSRREIAQNQKIEICLKIA